MHRDLLELLACPACTRELAVETGGATDDIESGILRCQGCGARYPIERYVPRFVPAENYSSSFGFQWNRFRRTQLDSSTGRPISHERFFAQSGWRAADMADRWTLDVGCGAGRFAEVAVSTGARVVALDYSGAVDACRENLGAHPRLDVIQADVYRLPFRPERFEFIYCFGVLQHTPDVRGAFMALRDPLAPGGRIAVDMYPRTPWNVLWPKYWLRPLTKRIAHERLFRLVTRMVDLVWPLSLALGRVPHAGRKLRHALPVANYDGVLPLTPRQLKEWAVLDTFDMLAPAHDHPQTVATLRQWFEQARLADVEVFRQGLVVGRGRRPAAEPSGA